MKTPTYRRWRLVVSAAALTAAVALAGCGEDEAGLAEDLGDGPRAEEPHGPRIAFMQSGLSLLGLGD